MGINLFKNVTQMETDAYSISAYRGSAILPVLRGSSLFSGDRYGGRIYEELSVTFKKPVLLDGLICGGISSYGPMYYQINGGTKNRITGTHNFTLQKVNQIKILYDLTGGYTSINYNYTLSNIQILGTYELHLLEIDNKLFTINGSTVTFVSDNIEASVSTFMSKGFTTDKLNSTIIKKLAELTKNYKVRTLKI